MTGFSCADREAFLVYLYFGSGKDDLDLCLDRAYLDFSRTLKGIGLHFTDSAELSLRHKASEALKRAMEELVERPLPADAQTEFDEWHEQTCRALQGIYVESGYERFSIGHAQKWVNMTLKYVFTLGEERLPGFSHLFALCHVPLDNIILGALKGRGLPKEIRGRAAWTRMDEYSEYLTLQQWIRDHFSGQVPLDVEFRMFMGKL